MAERDSSVPAFVQYTIVIVTTGTLLMAGHFVEVMVWAVTYALVGVAPARVELIYLAFGNYTTLGYADLVAPEQWRLLRPMTALNGIMLIGWSTALIIEILRRSGPRRPGVDAPANRHPEVLADGDPRRLIGLHDGPARAAQSRGHLRVTEVIFF